jgi:hypothetical protein
MKKLILLTAVAVMITISSQAQYNKGNFILSTGIGLGYYYAGGVPLQVNGEYFFTDKLSIGPYLGVTTWNHRWAGDRYNYTFIDVGVRGSYHFSELIGITEERLDIYGGAFLGYLASSFSGPNGGFYDDNLYGSRVTAGIHAGARYYFAPRVAGYGELGYGLAPLSIGLTFKF